MYLSDLMDISKSITKNKTEIQETKRLVQRVFHRTGQRDPCETHANKT